MENSIAIVNRIYIFIGKYFPELLALLSTLLVLIVGCIWAWNYDPAWLNRAGALITIIAILLAASRFHDKNKKVLTDLVNNDPEKVFQEIISVVEKEHGPLQKAELENIYSTIKIELLNKLNAYYKQSKHRIKNWEISLAVIGTFANGFGDYIISILKK